MGLQITLGSTLSRWTARREPRTRSEGTAEFLRLRIDGRREPSLAREGKNTWLLRTPFYGAEARLHFHAVKTRCRPRLCIPTAVQQFLAPRAQPLSWAGSAVS